MAPLPINAVPIITVPKAITYLLYKQFEVRNIPLDSTNTIWNEQEIKLIYTQLPFLFFCFMFFPLDFSREKNYYYAFNADKLANEGKLLSRVKENVLSQSHEKLKTTYAVYETQYEEDYVYVLSHSSMVQV